MTTRTRSRTGAPRPATVTEAFRAATQVADAVLFEGYVLYPYRASARKNQLRWQFGVLMPPGYGAGTGEHSASRTECLVDPRDGATVHVRVRFLQAQRRDVEARDAVGFQPVPVLSLSDREVVAWDEGVVREEEVDVDLARVLAHGSEHVLTVPGGRDTEDVLDDGDVVGRLVRRREELRARLSLTAERLEGPYGVVRLRLDLANLTAYRPSRGSDVDRADALRHALVAAHLLVGLGDAAFLSLLEPAEWARPAVEGCVNEHTWPVLVGAGDRHDVVLSSPIILYDHPQIAPESAGELYDSLEIDEILSLRTQTLTEQEKREARGTDPRAAAIIDRVDAMPAEVLDRLHGTIRYLRGVTGEPEVPELRELLDDDVTPAREDAPDVPGRREGVPWWDPGADASVSPETDAVVVGAVRVARGSTVRLRPRLHGADAQDVFLVGRTATVEAVLHDVDDGTHLAVTVDDDPGADLARAQGRFLYFRPDEVEPVRPEATS